MHAVGSVVQQAGRRPRKPTPLRSYVPFLVFVGICLLVLIVLIYVIARLLGGLGGGSGAPAGATATSTVAVVVPPSATAPPTDTLAPGVPTFTPAPPTATPNPAQETAVVGTALAQITPGGPLPPHTPAPTATATGRASLVVARDVDSFGRPVEQATRFVSPAMRLYAIATIHDVRSSDVLRFVFQRDGVTLPHDDISYVAGVDAAVHSFHPWADYAGGAKPLPHGSYRVLFYRNGRLEAVAYFRVG